MSEMSTSDFYGDDYHTNYYHTIKWLGEQEFVNVHGGSVYAVAGSVEKIRDLYGARAARIFSRIEHNIQRMRERLIHGIDMSVTIDLGEKPNEIARDALKLSFIINDPDPKSVGPFKIWEKGRRLKEKKGQWSCNVDENGYFKPQPEVTRYEVLNGTAPL